MALDAADLSFTYVIQLTAASAHCNLLAGFAGLNDGGFAMARPAVLLLGTKGDYCPNRHVTVLDIHPNARPWSQSTRAPTAMALRRRE